MSNPVLKNIGTCPVCLEETVFAANDPWLRDHYLCLRCRSLPRERALMSALERFYPNWRQLIIHESSPGNRSVNQSLQQQAPRYFSSQYFLHTPSGSMEHGTRCENLEQLSFADNSIDLHITQDVLEHVFHPEKAFAEIARTLKVGGAHIFTVPLVNKHAPTTQRARVEADGSITHLHEAQYHGNPINKKGSLVTFDWGYDIIHTIWKSSHLSTAMFVMDDLSQGIRAEYIEVLITQKLAY